MMWVLGIIYLFLLLINGYAIASRHLALKKIEGLACGFIIMSFLFPTLCFAAAILVGTNINLFLVFLILIGITVLNLHDIKSAAKLEFKINLKDYILTIFSIFVFIVYLINYAGPFLGYWDTYIAAPSIIMTGAKADFIAEDNSHEYNYTLSGKLPDDLVQNGSYGIITKDREIGASIIFSVPFLFFRLFGFRLFYSLFAVSFFLLSFYILRHLTGNFFVSIFFSGIMLLNNYMLSIKTLNPNFAGATLVLLIVLALTKRLGNLPWFFLGALYGLLGATRNLALFFLPAILYRTLYSSKPLKNLAFFISGAFIMVIPILFWNNYAFGNVFAHPTQYPWFEGYRPVFEHNFLGLRFEFNGLLNFPFFEKIIRTPHYPFPVFIYLPLLFVHVFGIILICLIPLGCYSLYKNQKKNAVFLAMFFFPYLFFLLFQENWEVAKTTFIILAMPGILFFMAQGISELFKMKAIRRNSIIFLFSFVVIVLAQHLASLSDFPADARWYKRFPKALNISEEKFDLYGGFDKEWKFFQFKENRVITAKQKEDLTSLNLLPDISINLFPDNEISKIENEFESKNIRIFNIWNTIYITTT